ncbi:unnamed protein product, partial [Meganyctiphanes norvegica]
PTIEEATQCCSLFMALDTVAELFKCSKCTKTYVEINDADKCCRSPTTGTPIASSSKSLHGGSRNQIWNADPTHALILCVRDEYKELTQRQEKNIKIFINIAKRLIGIVPGITGLKCQKKWNTLKSQYLKYEDQKKKTGESRKTEPKFYNELSEILSERSIVNPPSRQSCGLESQQSSPQPGTSGQASDIIPEEDI